MVVESSRTPPGEDTWEPLEIRPVQVVSRHEWGAVPMEGYPTPLQLPAPFVTLQYTGSKPCHDKEKCIKAVRKLQRNQMLRGYNDIKYSFLIGADGRVYEGRGWNVVPEANKRYKKLYGSSINIAFIWRHPEHISSKMPDLSKEYILFREEIKEQYKAPLPLPNMFHVLWDLLDSGVKSNYLLEDYSFFNSQ
ncbi:peptidoglycan-recognition protein SB2-like [Macrosteles quadrilineatus]|uniref:peptidoglycan-recognition protein SB2-like n=1 Tax=Macrosteles quadrilineatus TaxID=74068 RepID=UPI0023E17856|nr:peptidoglycan-recognition protein SB2-like [Macrosteles quadrilineatus]